MEFNPILRHTKDKKNVLDATFISIQHYRVCTKDKVQQSRESSNALLYTAV